MSTASLSCRCLSVVLFCALSWTGPARALSVEVNAPDGLEALLDRYLDAARAARLGETLADEEVARLRDLSLATARELLATEGYFSPTIDSRMTRAETGWHLRFTVTPGPRALIRAVDIGFLGAIAEAGTARPRPRIGRAERAEREFPLKPGMPFRQEDWTAAKAALLAPLLADRYPAARLAASEARVDPEASVVDLSLSVDSGPAFFHGRPLITGARRYPESIIHNLNPARPGQPVRQQDLLDYQAALEASGYYARASVRVDVDPALAAAAPIRVEVEERPEKLFSIGAGVSTDTGARARSSWLHRNVLDRGLRLKFDASLESTRQTGETELAWPRSADGYDHAVGLRLKREDIKGQESLATVAALRRARSRGLIETAWTLQYQTERKTLGSQPEQRNQALTVNHAWIRRELGRGFYPRRGHVLDLRVGGAAEALWSDTSFLRLHARHTRYLPVGERGRLLLRGELGGVLAKTRDGIPTDFLFRAGGDNSVRGYAYQSLGRTLDGGVASVRYLATGSVEYNHFPPGDWGLALFVDAGDAADSPGALSPVFGYGVGARYRSPVGPINLDLAYGEATGELRLHFSLGVSF